MAVSNTSVPSVSDVEKPGVRYGRLHTNANAPRAEPIGPLKSFTDYYRGKLGLPPTPPKNPTNASRNEIRSEDRSSDVAFPVSQGIALIQSLSHGAVLVTKIFRAGLLPLSVTGAVISRYIAQVLRPVEIQLPATIEETLGRFPRLKEWLETASATDASGRILDLGNGTLPAPADLWLMVRYLMKHANAEYHLFVVATPEQVKVFRQSLASFLGFDPAVALRPRFSVVAAPDATKLQKLFSSFLNQRQAPTVVLGAFEMLSKVRRGVLNMARVGLRGVEFRDVAPVIAAVEIHALVERAQRSDGNVLDGSIELFKGSFTSDLATEIKALRKLLSAA